MNLYKNNLMISFSDISKISMNIFKLLFNNDNFIDYFKIYKKKNLSISDLDFNKISYNKLKNNFNNNYNILINFIPLTDRKDFITLVYNNKCCLYHNFYYNIYYKQLNFIKDCNIDTSNLLNEFKNIFNNYKNISIINYIDIVINFIKKYNIKNFKKLIINKINDKNILSLFLLNNIYSSDCWKFS